MGASSTPILYDKEGETIMAKNINVDIENGDSVSIWLGNILTGSVTLEGGKWIINLSSGKGE